MADLLAKRTVFNHLVEKWRSWLGRPVLEPGLGGCCWLFLITYLVSCGDVTRQITVAKRKEIYKFENAYLSIGKCAFTALAKNATVPGMMHDDGTRHDDWGIAELNSAEEVGLRIEEIYGTDLRSTGLVHVTAVWHGGAGAYITLEIKPETPRCLHDLFALGLSRARADAILTTGKIVRQEPQLTHEPVGPAQVPSALAAWRREVLGKESAPITLVLTSGRDIDFAHPLFHAGTRAVIFTSREGQWALESQAANHGVEVVGVENPGAHTAIEFLRREFGAATISIEAGPSVSRQFYGPLLQVDELLLSVYEAPRIPQSVEGGFFLPRPELERFFSERSEPYGVKTEGGAWSLQRFLL